MGESPFFAIQPAFTGGEISTEVASRVDLDKYQLSLLRAENAIIRPYGPVYKRPGSIYDGVVGHPDRNDRNAAVLVRFEYAQERSYLLEIGEGYLRVRAPGSEGSEIKAVLDTPFVWTDLPRLRTVQSVDVMYICSGTRPVQKLMRYSDTNWCLRAAEWTCAAYGDINMDESIKIIPSGTSGEVTLTATKPVFAKDRIGDTMKLEQYVGGALVQHKGAAGVSASLRVGKTWKVVSHGIWTGTLTVQQSKDGGATWTNLRTYTSANDYNPMESGDVDACCMMRLDAVVSSGSVTANLSAYPYRHEGYVTVTEVTDATHATAHVDQELGAPEPTADWFWGAWSKVNGYPCCAAFFQDRLCFGGNVKYPQRLWMSRSGDYENFSVMKEAGTVTDDSAVTVDLLSRQAFRIGHMDVGNDLVIFTDGSIWTISGSETVKPTNVTPKNQESYGCSDVPPLRIGGRIVYVQRRGSAVRDTGYSYQSDGYVGMDLTLLAKHLLRGRRIVSAAYAQEPDSLLYFVTDDGRMLCLTYVAEQKVYAWSHFVTDGWYKAVATVNCGESDRVYVVVEREVDQKRVRYLEYFAPYVDAPSEQDYTMVDAAVRRDTQDPKNDRKDLGMLRGKTVAVMADGYYYEGVRLLDGDCDGANQQKGARMVLPEAARRVVVGLPYTMVLEQANWDAGMTESGTVQGRKKRVAGATLRLTHSYGGKIGPCAARQDAIVYDREGMELAEDVLYTGDKRVTLPAGGWDTMGRTCITHDTPYPFCLSALIREVTFGG